MGRSDYIPRRDDLFDPWFRVLRDYVIGKTSGANPEWAHIPQAEAALLSARFEAWHGAFLATVVPHAKPQTDAKKAERRESERFVRGFVNQYLRYKPVTDSDRDEMGIRNRKRRRLAVPAPDAPPDWSVWNDGLLRVRFSIRPEGAERPRIPQGYAGAVVRFVVADGPVTEMSLLTRSELLNRGISYMQFGQGEDGKFLSCALEWLTRSNKRGPVSDIQSIKVR